MEDVDKTNEQLLDEIACLRKRVQELEESKSQNGQQAQPETGLETLWQQTELQLVMDAVPALISFIDAEGCYRFNNRTYEEWFGHSRSKFYGRHLREVFRGASWDSIRPHVEAALAGNRVDYECQISYPVAGKRYVRVTYIPRFGKQECVSGFVVLVQDITRLKQVEAALRDSERRFRTLSDCAPVGIYVTDAVGHCTYVNDRWCEITQLLPAQAAGEGWVQALHSDDRQPIFDQWNAAVESGKEFALEYRFQHPDGTSVWVIGQATALRDEVGNVAGFIGTISDITARKQVEEALREKQERLNLAQAAAKVGSFEWNIQTNVNIWSKELEALYGLKPGEFGGSYEEWRRWIHPDDIAQAEADVQSALTTGELYTDWRIIWADESIHWLHARAKVFFDDEGNPLRMVGVNVDITEHKRAEETLRHNELIFRTLSDAMPQMFWVTQPDGYHEYFNQRWYDYTGVTLEQSRGEGWRTIVHPDDLARTIELWRNSVCTGTAYDIEYRLRRATDGEYRWHLGRALPLRQQTGQIVKWFGSCTDIHDQKLAVEERAQALERERAARLELEKASRMKDEFLAVLSHELRSPLNGILGWSRLLRSQQLAPDITEKALASIERNARAQTQLIEDLLDISRIIRGHMRLELRPTNLLSVVQAALDTVSPAAVNKSIAIEFSPDSNPNWVSGDPDRLQQVVWNLLSNAVKFTPAGGQVEVRLEKMPNEWAGMRAVEEKRKADGEKHELTQSANPVLQPLEFAQITVTDTGKGIKSDFLPYVFDYFRQADGSTTRTYGGLGLGLAIVRNLVELHGGKVAVASAGDGQGATFTIQLPLLQSDSAASEPEAFLRQTEANSKSVQQLDGLKILAVDDETDAREFLKTALEQHGASVAIAASVQEALQLMQTVEPDMLLSDIGMPNQDGYMLIQEIRSLPPEKGGQVPAVALTAYARESDRLQAMAAGFQLHLPKPIELTQLIATVMKLAKDSVRREADSNN
jgi:PAS domain S-box-containing protein